ncbi:hypothetical protein [Burkholderia pyrrocinia]|uniref:hypothetical protein n=1 Tax=Burkholderia pyrrocinia TaxID=60550 RepID=UPI001BCC73C5|nr:hypothetical protein [Burkholderia pyrrocinia]QVN21007.1 hypothetical protein JYG32_31210 [Burkholderia pyrrocinia]
MTTKMPTLQTFMTNADEAAFSDFLKTHIPSVKFIDSYIWNSPVPPAYNSMTECHGQPFSNIVIINEEICSVERYAREFIAPHPGGSGYMGSMEGPGAIQFLRSREADYAPECLRDGRLAASYDPAIDPATDVFVKMTWNVFKKFAHKTFVVNRETGVVNEKPESRFFAEPDAAAKFDGMHGHYLTNNAFFYLVAKSPK